MNFKYLNPNHSLFTVSKMSAQLRLQEARKWRERSPHWFPFGPCGNYHYRSDADQEYMSFYLESDFMPDLRWQWADEVTRSIEHLGWFTDEFGDAEKARGFIMRLPHGRGFLAGWSLGEGMCAEVERYIYDNETDAAHAADSMAEHVAEKERESEKAEQAAA